MDKEISFERQLKEAIEEEKRQFETFYRWVEKNFPASFFKEVSPAWISLIVHALIGFKVQDFFSEIHLKEGAISLVLDGPESDVRILERFPLYGIKSYTTYISKEPPPFPGLTKPLRIALIYFTEAKEEVIETLGKEFLPLFERAKTRDHCQLEMRGSQLLLAWRNVPKYQFLYRLARVILHHRLVMKQVKALYKNEILLLSMTLEGTEAIDLADFLQEVATLKYFDSLDLIDHTFVRTGLLSGNLANFLRTTVNFVHQILVHLDRHRYTLEKLMEGICRHPELTVQLAHAFVQKFHPEKHDLEQFAQTKAHFIDMVKKLDTGNEHQDELARHLLLQSMNFVTHILKCNFYRKNKSSFSFRLDPLYLEKLPFDRKILFPEMPFAIFFVKGMHFLAFHIRFQDLARGGLRTVYAVKEHMLKERDTLFVECYNLALTQQKKNKDIPEGGAKGVIFLKPYERLIFETEIYRHELELASVPKEIIEQKITHFQEEQKKEYLYQTQRSFVDSLLTIINCNEDGTLKPKRIVDYYQKPEYIYLGPDENMHDSMIEWIAAKSIKEGYRPMGAFISSKPSCGINHKEYGVTSAGVNVYMEQVLHYLKIDPQRDRFTIKMTGGPDGDVAGNQICNLYRYYSNTAKLVALTDVSGTIYDPEGLDLEALVGLFKRQKSIRFYPPDLLHEEGFLLDLETKRETTPFKQETLCWRKGKQEWLSGSEMHALFRNNVHRTKADLFLPCGGRPKTLNESNYQDFLDEGGGANGTSDCRGG